MNQHRPSQRRRRAGAYAGVLGAAVGSASAAAMILAAPAGAVPDGADAAGVVCTECELNSLVQLIAYEYFDPSKAIEAADVKAIDEAFGGSPADETFLINHPYDLFYLVGLDTYLFDTTTPDNASGILALADTDYLAFLNLPVESFAGGLIP